MLSGLKHGKTKSIPVIPQTAKLKKEAAVSNPTVALCIRYLSTILYWFTSIIMFIDEAIPVNQQNSMLFTPSLKTNEHGQLANHH